MPTSRRYRVPPMPFSLTPARHLADLVHNTVPGVRTVRDLPMPSGRGTDLQRTLLQAQHLPIFRPFARRPLVGLLEFG